MLFKGWVALLPVLLFLAHAQSEDELALKSRQAKEMMAAGRFEEAIPVYQQLVKAVPGNPGLVLNLALAEHMAGHQKEAIPHFEAVLKTQPTLLPALASLGAARLALNQPEQAIAPLQKALAVDAQNRDVRGMLAGALMGTGRAEQAAEQFRKLTEIAPDDARAWHGLGNSYESIATAAFERLQTTNPKSPYLGALIADTRVRRRQYRGAFVLFQEVLKELPNVHGIHASMAEIYRKTGHSDWAAAEDAKERALPPADCAAHPGECQFVAGHNLQALGGAGQSAEALYWRAKAANELALQAFFRLGQLPPSVELHRLRAEIARNQNQHMESVKEWRAALVMQPGNPRLQNELAVSLFLAKDYEAAMGEGADLLRANPRSPELNFLFGDGFLRMEEPAKAVPYLEKALAADPKMLAADASLGLALSRVGRSAEAVRHLERALDTDEDGSLHYQLARAYQAAGAVEKARATMAQYQEILKRIQQQKEEGARDSQITAPPR